MTTILTSTDAVGLAPCRVSELLGSGRSRSAAAKPEPTALTPQRVGMVRRLLRSGFTRAGVSRHLSIPMDVLNRALDRRR